MVGNKQNRERKQIEGRGRIERENTYEWNEAE
jgi:hypothetical protein